MIGWAPERVPVLYRSIHMPVMIRGSVPLLHAQIRAHTLVGAKTLCSPPETGTVTPWACSRTAL